MVNKNMYVHDAHAYEWTAESHSLLQTTMQGVNRKRKVLMLAGKAESFAAGGTSSNS